MDKFNNKDLIVFVGDSITHNGTFISRISDYYLTKAKIKCAMCNWGVSGNTSIKTIKRLDKILELKPNVVVIMFGMNDVNYTLYNPLIADEERIKLRPKAIEDNILAFKKICFIFKSHNIRVICCTPTQYDELSDATEVNCKGTCKALHEFSKEVKKIAKENDFEFVDFNSMMTKAQKKAVKNHKSYNENDRIHPTAVGHELIARYFLKEQGFDIDFTLDYFVNENYSLLPFSKIEKERRRLEIIAKSSHYARYDYFYNAKNDKECLELTKKTLASGELDRLFKGGTLSYIKEQFKLYIKNFNIRENLYKDYIKYLRKIIK